MGYLQIEIGGEKRGLKFDIGTLKCFQDLFGIDPFEFKIDSSQFHELFPFALKIFHAGLARNAAIKKEALNLSAEQVEELACEMDIPLLTDIVTEWNSIMVRKVPSANGEVSADTQPIILQ